MNKRKYQIFVSSTFTDLIDDRQAAVAAILKAGHIPAGMELFTAGDKSQLATIEKWIDESDGYMLILGGRYGSIEPASGISYTELEYDYAIQQGKPLFAVVINEEALETRLKAVGRAVIEQENPQALKIFREKVLSNVSSFFSDEKDIKLCVHESLADLRDNPAAIGWVSAADVEDTRALHEDLARLRKENDTLKEKLKALEKSDSRKSGILPAAELNELFQLLMDTIIKIPEDVSNGSIETMKLGDIFISNSTVLINGVTNALNAGAFETFLYFNVCPKLTMHGLVTNEKVPGVKYRRSFVNEKGLSFLAQIEKLRNEQKRKLPPVTAK
ncbi:DUF4062 domain-containing protein [Sphingomonas aerolata]|uniref:DUF4062 domain-containing protein n=1 Tax=Sphingomonas aerolata TaxID=185951 RepID=UPI00334E00EF